MEDGEIRESAELSRKIAGDIGMVKINAGDDSDGGVGR